MKKGVKIAIGAASALAIGALGYWLINKNKPSEQEDSQNVVDDVVNAEVSVISKCSREAAFPLKKGSVGKQVKDLQVFLNRHGVGAKIVEDCDFGLKTENKLSSTMRALGFSGAKTVDQQFYTNVVAASLRQGKIVGIPARPQSWA